MSTNLDRESNQKIISHVDRQTLNPAKESPIFPRVRRLAREIRNYGIGALFGRRYEEVTTYTIEVDPHELTGRPHLRLVPTTRRVRL